MTGAQAQTQTPNQASTAAGAEIVVTPYLCVKNGAAALEFYKRAFGAVETMRLTDGDRVSHAEIRIGGATIYLADEFPEIDVLSPETIGGSAVLLHLTVPDVDTMFQQAIAAGATQTRPVDDQDHDRRSGKLRDPFGHNWMLSSFSRDG